MESTAFAMDTYRHSETDALLYHQVSESTVCFCLCLSVRAHCEWCKRRNVNYCAGMIICIDRGMD